jgi:uncharacterized protein (DUF433 family)
MADALVQALPEVSDGTPVFSGAEELARELFDHLRAGGSVDAFLQARRDVRRDRLECLLRAAERTLLDDIEDQRDIDFARLHQHEPGIPLEEVMEELGISKEEVGL